MITFARAGDEEAGGLPVLMRAQLPTNSITGDGATTRDEIGAPFFTVYGISIRGYTGFEYGL
jgi:hypothetical protein